MKNLIVTTKELKALGLMKLEDVIKARITKIEKKTVGNGFVVVTTNKQLSETGVFQIDNLNTLSAIASSMMCSTDDLAPADIRQFINSINSTSDLDKSYLALIYHKTVKNLAFKANAELTAMFKDVVLDEEVLITEGYEMKDTGERKAFEGLTRTNNQSFELSALATDKFESYQSNVTTAIKLAIRAEKQAGVKPVKHTEQVAERNEVPKDDDVLIGAN